MDRWDALREKIKSDGLAQLADDRHRTDRDDRFDRRLLRVHRAAGVEPFQTRNAVRRFRSDQQISRQRAARPPAFGPTRSATRSNSAKARCRTSKNSPDELKAIYRTAWEIPMRSLIDMAADRGAFIDQSQSLNLFMESPNIGKLSSMYMYAWQKGLKTTYYLRSRPATRIAQVAAGETTARVRDARSESLHGRGSVWSARSRIPRHARRVSSPHVSKGSALNATSAHDRRC